MKKILTFLMVITTLNALASVDTGAIATIDTAFIPKSAIRIYPISINLKGDSAYSFTWGISGLNRDTSTSVVLSVSLLDKSGNKMYNVDYPIPSFIINKGINIGVIDNFILTRNKMFIKN